MSKRFNNQTYFQMGTGFDDPFTRVPNIILDEKNISAKALGIYVKIIRFQNSTEHKIYISSLANELKEGKDAIRSAIQELMELGYIEREILRNEKGHMNGYVYTVHAQPIENTTIQPSSEKPMSVEPVSDNTTLKKKITKKENKKKENNVVVVVNEKETQLLEIYKSYKIEKRVMPHTIKLLREYVDKFDLDLFEQIFISASEESVKKKYAYMKKVFEELVKKNIKTLVEFEEDNKKYKDSKAKKSNSSTSKESKPLTRFHNIHDRTKDYTAKELENLLRENQKNKFSKDEIISDVNETHDEAKLREQAINILREENPFLFDETKHWWIDKIDVLVNELKNNQINNM